MIFLRTLGGNEYVSDVATYQDMVEEIEFTREPFQAMEFKEVDDSVKDIAKCVQERYGQLVEVIEVVGT